MTGLEILADLARRRVQLSAEGDELSIRAPKGVLTAEIRALLSQHKAEILSLLVQRSDQRPGSALPQIVPAPGERHSPFPLTDMQQAYWIGRSVAFELGQVACQFYLEFENVGLDLERLSVAWRKLVERHDMLRAIVLPNGQQQILERVPAYEIEVLDLRGYEPETSDSRLLDVRRTMSHRVSSTDRWPLFEIRATRMNGNRTRLHFRIELIIADAWSVILLLKEWSHLYLDPGATIEPLALSFRDYVMMEIGARDTEDYRRSRDYWLGRLSKLPAAPELPLAENPASIKDPRFIRRVGQLDAKLWQQLKSRAGRSGLTPSGVLCAAFAEVLTVWSKVPRFTMNLTFFSRLPVHPQVKEIIGDFTSTILLAVDGSGPTFEARAQQIQEQLARDLEYSRFSGVQVVRELNRIEGGFPTAAMPIVFTSGLSLRDEKESPAMGPGEIVHSISQTPQVWLDHQAFEQGGTLLLSWDAVEALFPEGLLDDMFDAYIRLLHRLSNDETSWQETSRQLVPQEQLIERAAINDTRTAVPARLLHDYFREQVRHRPLQTAIVSSDRTLTYDELHRRANRVAQSLRRLGARPNSLVAILMDKGWEQVVAALSVLQSGAAYLPIDSDLPQERQWYLLENGEVDLVLTQTWLDENLSWPVNTKRLCLDREDLRGEEPEELEPSQDVKDLAYVIYTSGSTGSPKGVAIDHRGVVNTILDINQRFRVGPEDRVLALSSLGFDLSVYDIFGTLAAGGTIVIPDSSQVRNPAHWSDLMVREDVTIWNSVPALMEMLLESLAGRQAVLPSSLRLVLLSGDWIPVPLPDQIKRMSDKAEVISLGGATEASIWSILYPIESVDPSWKSIPYGRPMSNQSFHVLSDQLEACPVWVPGHLHIGGIGLANGYWRDNGKTRASFIEHPQTGERLYRTGDWGRYLPDGNVEFLGREDFQVKIGGHRIELGEIESALAQCPGIRSGVVTAMGPKRGYRRLVGYVVSDHDQESKSIELREFLKKKLPEYMVPHRFVFLDALPLTPNGKINRQALPGPDAVQLPVEANYVPPQTEAERSIAEVWQEMLQRERVGINDNFFDLGGNSLLMVQAEGRLREVFKRDSLIVAMFQFPTIKSLAEYLTREAGQPTPRTSRDQAESRRDAAHRRKQLRTSHRASEGGLSKPSAPEWQFRQEDLRE